MTPCRLPLPKKSIWLPVQVEYLTAFDRPLTVSAREVPLLDKPLWTRSLGKLSMEVATQGWRFPLPVSLSPGLPVLNRRVDRRQGDKVKK